MPNAMDWCLSPCVMAERQKHGILSFHALLTRTCNRFAWTIVKKHSLKRKAKAPRYTLLTRYSSKLSDRGRRRFEASVGTGISARGPSRIEAFFAYG